MRARVSVCGYRIEFVWLACAVTCNTIKLEMHPTHDKRMFFGTLFAILIAEQEETKRISLRGFSYLIPFDVILT